MAEKRPNLFIAGGPRCGTTAMSRYLEQHPEIFVPGLKEPNYYASDFAEVREVDDPDQYAQLYEKATASERFWLDGSPHYLYSDVAIEAIAEESPDARFIAMLRNPLDMVVSYHARRVATFAESETDFETAWHAGMDNPSMPALQRYDEIGKFGEQLEELLEIFPRQQIKTVVFDDFARSPEAEFHAVLDFLDLERVPLPDTSKVNANISSFRAAPLMKFLRQPPPSIRWLESRVKSSLGISRFGVVSYVEKKLGRRKERQDISATVASEVSRTYARDVKLLGDLLNRDLSHWVAEN